MSSQVKALIDRINSLEKLMQLELASADLMDDLVQDWASNMRQMSRQIVALTVTLADVISYCEQAGVDLGDLHEKALDVLKDF